MTDDASALAVLETYTAHLPTCYRVGEDLDVAGCTCGLTKAILAARTELEELKRQVADLEDSIREIAT